MLRQVHLHGCYGNAVETPSFLLDVDNRRSVISAMKRPSMFPELAPVMRSAPEAIIAFSDSDDIASCSDFLSATNADAVWPDKEHVHIVPIVDGQVPAAALVGVFGAWAGVAAFVINFAISMALQAIMQSLAPKPDAEKTTENSNKNSFIFNGATNTNEQGGPVPICYGVCAVGSVVPSADMEVVIV